MISADRLRDLFDYDPTTGVLKRKRTGKLLYADSGHGYPRIWVDGQMYLAHRLAWLHFYGEWPCGQLDHRNRVRTDNRIANLRLATQGENRANENSRPNKSGLRGAYLMGGRRAKPWMARVIKDGKRFHLGYYASAAEAHAAYRAAAEDLYGEFNPN